MKRMPNILMAGASGRNLGKTEFLCRVIQKQSKQVPVIAVKVTTMETHDMAKPYRRTIPGSWQVTREHQSTGSKDTHRMLQAGASRVYWLRVQRPALQQGLQGLMGIMKADGIDLESECIVMESGNARAFIDQSLFVQIVPGEEMGRDKIACERSIILNVSHSATDIGDNVPPASKPSVAAVSHLADSTVRFLGNGWDLAPEHLTFNQGYWGLKEQASAIIMSGGQSRRMGRDKSIIPLHGRPLISSLIDQLQPNFESVLLSGSKEKYAFTGCPVIEDIIPGNGPLMGLLSTLKASKSELNFVTACDVPDLNLPFVRRMIREIGNHDAVVPVVKGDQKQPLFAVYRKSVVSDIEEVIKQGKRSLHVLLDRLDVHYIETDGHWYHNLNTPTDLERYKQAAS
jgi:molybdopterin-guanine dinucleotide biosynthesis protein A